MVATSCSRTHFFRKDMGASGVGEGSVLRMGIAGLQDVDILARCEGRTQGPCQETGFPGKRMTWLDVSLPCSISPDSQHPLNDLFSKDFCHPS